MNPNDNLEEAIKLLQMLGLSELEASCYVGLTRMDWATSRKLSEVAEIPRTRVYDATRTLEAQGLVEVQHTSPKRFRAVPIEEALDRIRNRYQTRFDELQEALNTIEPVGSDDDAPTLQVWSMTGREAIESRAIQLVKDASEQVVLALGDESLLTQPFLDALTEAGRRLELVIYAPTAEIRDRIDGAVPGTKTVLLRPERFRGPTTPGARAAFGRILLVDQSASLISTIDLDTGGEQAVFSQDSRAPVVSLVCQHLVDDCVLAPSESEP